MAERKGWTQEEDKILKSLYDERKISKWSEIARLMEAQFHMPGRNGKQCRQRYHNHLDNSIKREKWSREEQEDLISIHSNTGNRWAVISRAIPGRSENCIKNKFYSILRRGLKVINNTIRSKLKRYKQLDIGIVYKIIQACESSYKKKSLSKQMIENLEIKKEIIHYGMLEDSKNSIDPNRIKNLIEKIKLFSKNRQQKGQTIQEKPRKKDDNSLQSQEIDQSEFRDNITDLRTKKTSLHNLMLEPIEQEHEEGSEAKTSGALINTIGKPKKLSSKESNKSFDLPLPELRPYDLLPVQSIKSFEFPEFDNGLRSPRPVFYGDSPYFDQLRPSSSFNSWSQFYPQ